MGLADNFLRQIEVLETALKAKRSGLPERLIALTYSDRPHDMDKAVQALFDKYGVDREVLEAAGSRITKVSLPWAEGRGVGITSRKDPRVMRELQREMNTLSEDPTSNGAASSGVRPQVDTQPHHSLTQDPIGR